MPLDQPTIAYVWIWLPGERAPVVAGRLDDEGPITTFTYGRSFLERDLAIPLYAPELPLIEGRQEPEFPPIHGCIADAGPDAWGQRVISRRHDAAGQTHLDLTIVTYLLESSSDRIGALDFQPSSHEYRSRTDGPASLEQLMRAAEAVDESLPLPPELEAALVHGTSLGGAQPKAALFNGTKHLIAKFSSRIDVLPVVKLEYVAMTLAREAGIGVAPVEIAHVLGKDVLLVERFDRSDEGTRSLVVSARTMLRVAEMGIGSSYSDLAVIVRERFTKPEATLEELFSRITFSILVGNTDDHARNHAAFWNGLTLTLTPAYDITPQPRRSEEANQAMAIGSDDFRASQVAGCVERSETYLVSQKRAREIVDQQIAVIEDQWESTCDRAGLTDVDRAQHWQRQFLNPYALRGY
jgi:serine/threonine-protein kinase HipA